MASIAGARKVGEKSRPSSLLLLCSLFLATQLQLGSALELDVDVPGLTIANRLDRPLTVVHMPGCCSPCGFTDPPPELQCYSHGCVRCPNLVLDAGDSRTLSDSVVRFPLPSLRIQVADVAYCVGGEDLKLIVPAVTLSVGPGNCGLTGLHVSVFGMMGPPPGLCVPVCPSSV